MERFPDQADQIEKLFSGCEGFREICEDYVICLNAIRKIESTNPVKKQEFLKDFEDALNGLEEELLLELKNDKSSNILE